MLLALSRSDLNLNQFRSVEIESLLGLVPGYPGRAFPPWQRAGIVRYHPRAVRFLHTNLLVLLIQNPDISSEVPLRGTSLCNMSPAVFLPARLGVLGADRLFLPVAQLFQLPSRQTQHHQVLRSLLRPRISERQIVGA
jgi:hypothetical protein